MHKKPPTGKKGFLFTIDALASLAIIIVAASAVIAFNQAEPAQPHALYSLARDYLEEKYLVDSGLSAAYFKYLTGFNASENPTGGTLVARGTLFVYPGVLASCNCSENPCWLSAGTDDSCLYAQENLNNSLKQVWVSA